MRHGADPGDNLQESLRRADEAAKHFCTNIARRAHAEARPQKLRFEKLQPPLKQGELLERLPELAVLATVICYRNSCCIHCPDTARQVQQTPMPALLLFREPGPLGNWKPPASPTLSAWLPQTVARMTKGSETSSYNASTDEIPLEEWKQVLLEYFQSQPKPGL